MREWIVMLILYLLAVGLFRVLGGLGSAAEAFRSWGRHSTAPRADPQSS